MITFKLLLQLAHHAHDEFDERQASAAEVLHAFDTFDWSGEVARAKELQRVSPTLSIETPAGRLLWVSAVGDGHDFEFISEYLYPGIKTSLFGLCKKDAMLAVEVPAFTLTGARRALELFVKQDHETLLQHYRRT